MPSPKQPISKHPPMSAQEAKLLRTLFIDRGWPAHRIAEKLGVCKRTIYSRLEAHGIRALDSTPRVKPKYCPHCGSKMR